VFFILSPHGIHKLLDAINQVRHVQFEWIVQDIVTDDSNFTVIPAKYGIANHKLSEIRRGWNFL
jgi:hypothetical protein